MRLENLYPNFGRSSPEEQAEYIAAYRLRRAQDLATIPVSTRKKPSTSTRSAVSLTDEEKAIMKMLGLKQKDIVALRATAEEIEEDNGAELFKDTTFEEDEDE